MIKNIFTLFFLLPVLTFGQETPEYTLNTGGIFLMVFAWSAILIWNAVCFTKILSEKKEK